MNFSKRNYLSKMSLQSDEHKYVLELLQKITCSKSEVEYDEQLQCGHHSVIAYYSSNWHPIQHQWCTVIKPQDLHWVRELQVS